jgi:hypothetical protein
MYSCTFLLSVFHIRSFIRKHGSMEAWKHGSFREMEARKEDTWKDLESGGCGECYKCNPWIVSGR